MDVLNITADAETFTCNVYLVPDDRTLIDAGAMPSTVEAVSAHVSTLERIVLTHQHGDHVAQLESLCDVFDPAVYAQNDHPLRTDELAGGDTLAIGDESFTIVDTPGHAEDHVSLVSDSTLFSGDVVVHDDGAFDYGSFGRTDMPGQSREVLIESIERLLETMPDSVEHLYAGHGDVFHGDVRDVVQTALERAEKREPKYPD